MSEISAELKERIINYCNERKEDWLEYVRAIPGKTRYLTFPVMIDGVFDFVRYDRKEERLDQIKLCIAKDDISRIEFAGHSIFGNDTVLAGEVEYVTIPLEGENGQEGDETRAAW